jgi:hypothetical protein
LELVDGRFHVSADNYTPLGLIGDLLSVGPSLCFSEFSFAFALYREDAGYVRGIPQVGMSVQECEY